MNGRGIDKDYIKAFNLFVKGAQFKLPEAFLNLGILHFGLLFFVICYLFYLLFWFIEGWGVAQDFEKAASYFRNIIGGGLSSTTLIAEYYYAEMYHYGIGVRSDCPTSLLRYKNVAEKGSWLYNMKKAYQAFEEDEITRSLIIYEKLAEFGNVFAQTNAGYLYEEYTKEQTLETNNEKILQNIIRFYSHASDQGNDYAYLRLGDYYYYGIFNLTMDHAKAANYYRYISNIHPQAHYNLAYMHHYGDGVKKDIYLAKRYYDMTLEMQPNAFIPVYVGLFNIGIEYALQLYHEDKFDQLLSDSLDYFTPIVFIDFYKQILEGKNHHKNIKLRFSLFINFFLF